MCAQQGDDTIFQDAAATFRSLKVGDAEPAEGEAANDDSSSSSSSNDDADVTLRMPASVVMQVQPLQRTVSRAAHHEAIYQGRVHGNFCLLHCCIVNFLPEADDSKAVWSVCRGG